MERRMTVHQDGNPIYDIVMSDSFGSLATEVAKLAVEGRRICIVTDSTVAGLYLEEVRERLAGCCKEVVTFVFPAGEENKNLKTVQALYETLILNHLDRKDLLVALGGGVVGDLCGYAAATYLRGVSFIQIPTTLLSQVDSSIGGKTGVDFDAYKNMVGAFHMPRLVYTNVKTLTTLSQEQFSSGMGEIIKHGLIKDAAYYQWLKDNREKIMARDLEACADMIERSDEIKREVVEKDPTEQGDRALLNFGHTLGHAIEKLKNFELLHGECVAIGMVAASYLSYLRNMITEAQYRTICEMIQQMQLPTTVEGLTKEDIVSKNDKKMNAGQIRFILLDDLGNAVMTDDVTDEELSQALDAVITA